jgi:hypothetical protein
MNKTLSLRIMALLALVQGAFGLLRAYGWVQIGVDLFREGLLILPILGVGAVIRGMFVAVVALLYFLFFCDALLGRSRAWWAGVVATVINLLLVFNGLIFGAPLAQAAVWAVVPAILLAYLLSYRA